VGVRSVQGDTPSKNMTKMRLQLPRVNVLTETERAQGFSIKLDTYENTKQTTQKTNPNRNCR